ncbi:Nucleoside triphosphate pyrophosphohydrolase [Thalassocella blandensis]|nr:Nucleoside triphosphate pyrophosphohydrolase [Thalassocella blandensis]
MSEKYNVNDLIYLMERLRDPESGCPWDLKQDYKSITPSTLEEAYEVVDAIEHADYAHLKEELGDFLFQVVFYTQLAKEEQRFDFHEVVDALTAKLVRRHPHVFPDGSLKSKRDSQPNALEEKAIKQSWEQIKEEERHSKGKKGLLDDVPLALPALSRAAKLQKRAAKIGFDWPYSKPVIEKIHEELSELEEAMEARDEEAMAEEMGDLLFTCVNLSRHLKLDPEAVLRRANLKFESRFRSMEAEMQESTAIQNSPNADLTYSAEALEALWQQAKRKEKVDKG